MSTTATTTTTATASEESSVNEEPSSQNTLTRALPPSHILQDGRFIYLPPPSNAERGRFLERSIAKYGLLNQDLGSGLKETKEKEEKKEEEENDVKIHPLAVASARLHANGMEELSKAINLSGLVSAGEYLGLSNIVDPSLEGGNTNKKAPDATVRAEYIGKRKRAQFCSGSEFLEQQSQRLAQAMTAQQVMDHRLVELRKKWRLVAPEHGTRAQPHAVRPTEVVAIDVAVYDRDRTGGGNQALLDNSDMVQGRIARRVPRYATVELQDSYNVSQHVEKWKERALQGSSSTGTEQTQEDSKQNVKMTDATEVNKEKDAKMATTTESPSTKEECHTRCEPFAVADPALGKLDVDFDPDKVPMLTLELTIEKALTGFHQSTCLSPIGDTHASDEDVVVALQHSLFCASLFETIRQELFSTDQQHVWLQSDADENFLPPPSQMAGSIYNGDVASLCIVHCHDGEVKVQLDCEYVLTVKLVEANNMDTSEQPTKNNNSGTQSPAQLQVLCRALLLQIQDVYHSYCIKTRSHSLKEKENEAPGLARIKKKSEVPSPHILQNCVSLGTKMLFESKIRRVLKRIDEWLKRDMHTDEALAVTWLPLSVFDLRSQFALCFREFLVDVSIVRDGMTVTSCGPEVGYKSVDFNSDVEFELFVKHKIRKALNA